VSAVTQPQGAARQAAVAARRQAAQEHTLSHPRFTHLVLAPAPAASLEGLAAAFGAQRQRTRGSLTSLWPASSPRRRLRSKTELQLLTRSKRQRKSSIRLSGPTLTLPSWEQGSIV